MLRAGFNYKNKSMNYICLSFTVNPPEPGSEILASALAEGNFESFVYTEKGFDAFIPQEKYNELIIKELKENFVEIDFSFSKQEIPKENWNKEWESNFQPVLIEPYAQIRASFHPAPTPPLMDIIIEPKMSFGTGHHSTTKLMSQALFEIPVKEKHVLDVGCGTGVLSIIAKKLGATRVVGVDIDEWSVENSRENRKLNGFSKIDIDFLQDTIKGAETNFNIILANINRNILAQEMNRYAKHLLADGYLLLSGFFVTDAPDLIEIAKQNGLAFVEQKFENEWAMLILKK